MGSKATIELDFRKAVEKARQLEDIASLLKNLADNDFENSLQDLSVAWSGENANAYLEKGNNLKGDIHITAENLQEVANSIRFSAQKIYDAEMEALRIAEVRSYRS